MMFQSQLIYDPIRIHAAALYCSDGRVGEHFDDFLQNGLRLPRYDRVALPGGPACLADHAEAVLEHKGVVEELRFLTEVHGLERMVLIAHEGCAYYSNRLAMDPQRVEAAQRQDLIAAADYIRRITGVQNVEAYYARRLDYRIAFEEVALTG